MSGMMYQGDYDYNDFLDVFLAEGGDPNHLHVYFENPVDVEMVARCRAAGVRVWVAWTPTGPLGRSKGTDPVLKTDRTCRDRS
jgi:hypothetical protein